MSTSIKSTAEVVVIGAGVVGSSVAYHLALRGVRDILVIDRANGPGLGSTGRATGGARAQFGTEINIKMSMYSLKFFAESDFKCDYDPKGYLFFTNRAEEFARLKANLALQKSLGLDEVVTVTPEEIAELCPIIDTSDIIGGTFCPTDGFINPLKVMGGFASSAGGLGVRFSFGIEVHGIEASESAVKAVKTSDGIIETRNVILCGGAWAGPLAATAGIDLPVSPQRRQIAWARAGSALPENMPMVIDSDTGFHFRPAKDFIDPAYTADNRHVLFAFPDSEEKSSFEDEVTESFLEKVKTKAAERSQILGETEIVREKCRAGLYENTPDHHAILGASGVEGLFLANGFSGHGVMHSPATGRALAEIVVDGESTFIDVSCLSIDRFRSGRLLTESSFI
jgi:sarcosine oxidase subunit beta